MLDNNNELPLSTNFEELSEAFLYRLHGDLSLAHQVYISVSVPRFASS